MSFNKMKTIDEVLFELRRTTSLLNNARLILDDNQISYLAAVCQTLRWVTCDIETEPPTTGFRV